MKRHRADLALVAALVAAATAASPAIAVADTSLEAPGAMFVSAWGGTLAWNAPPSPDGRHRAVIREGLDTRTVRRPTSTGLVDPDVGRAPSGAARVVFDACSLSRRCGLYRVERGSTTGRLVPGTRRSGRMVVAGSQWDGTYVFGRIGLRDPQVGRARRAGAGLFVARGSRVRRLTTQIPQDTDIQGARVAYAWWSPGGASAIYLTTTSGRTTCRLARASGSRFVSTPVIDDEGVPGRYVYWMRRDSRTAGGRIERVRFSGRGCPRSADVEIGRTALPTAPGGEEGGVDSLAVDAGTVFYSALGVWRAEDPLPFGGP